MDVRRPPGWPTVVPRIFCDDPGGLIAFLRDVFGATGDGEGSQAPAEMWIGDAVLLISGTEARSPMAACLYVYVDSADATYERATQLGALPIEAPRDLPYGDRRAMFEDCWGNTWQVAEYRR